MNAVDAHAIAQTAGHDTPEGEALLDDLFSRVAFTGAGVRESLIVNIAASYCWQFDDNLRQLANPWPPIIDLYGLGYTSSDDDDPEGSKVSLPIGYNGGSRSYRII
jgi:hypothetical protein